MRAAWLSLFIISLLALGLAACAVPGETGGDPAGLSSGELDALARQAKARETATAAQAQATDRAAAYAATSTEQALNVSEHRAVVSATASSLELAAAQAKALATATAQAVQTQAAATATAQAAQLAQTATAQADARTATASARAATLQVQQFQATQAAHAATATTEAEVRAQDQAEADARRAEQWREFFDALLRFLLVVGVIVVSVIGFVTLWRYADVLVNRQRLIETRSGTLQIMPGGLAMAISATVTRELAPGEDPEASQAGQVRAEAIDLLKFVHGGKTEYLSAHDPQDEVAEKNRALALRLLRANLQQFGASSRRIAGFRDLGWSSETWVRAVDLLRPYLVIKQGRGGGTWCGAQYPTLAHLYDAVGSRRVRLLPPPPPVEVSEGAANVL